ncbi:MAG: tol-pal system protein YbgF [Nitrospirota bacterium]
MKRRGVFKITGYCIFIAAFCLLSACATVDQFDLLTQEVNKVKYDNIQIKNDLTKLKEGTSVAVQGESLNVIRQNQAEMQSLLSNLLKDIQVTSGRFEENKHFTEKLMKDWATEMDIIKAQIKGLEDQLKDIKGKLSALESQTIQQKAPSKTDIHPQEKETEKPPAVPDKFAKYDSAYNLFKDRNYKEARQKFEAFLKEYPNDERSDNAQFWIAECYYREEDFENAILSYETLLKKYPNSQKVPGALLKQGLAFIEIQDKRTGRVILEQLIERFPNSREANLAKKIIEDMEGKAKRIPQGKKSE